MLIREGPERTARIDIGLAALLAAIAGALNAAGFQATGFFSANMTGNVSAMADHIGLGGLIVAAGFAGLIALFVAGAFTSGLLIEAGRKRGVRAIYAYSITLEAGLLVALGLSELLLPGVGSGWLVVTGLSFIMGLQNAATTRISDARVRTTHVSGMATDIGLGLAAMATRTDGRDAAVARLRLYAATLAAFTLGGISGAAAYLAIGGWLLIICAACLLALALPEARRAARPRASAEA